MEYKSMFETALASKDPAWTVLYSTDIKSQYNKLNLSILETANGHNVNICKMQGERRFGSISLRFIEVDIVIRALERGKFPFNHSEIYGLNLVREVS